MHSRVKSQLNHKYANSDIIFMYHNLDGNNFYSYQSTNTKTKKIDSKLQYVTEPEKLNQLRDEAEVEYRVKCSIHSNSEHKNFNFNRN